MFVSAPEETAAIGPRGKIVDGSQSREFEPRTPDAADRVLLNPATGKPLTRPRLYHRMLALGKRAGVVDAHPHRFSDTLAVDMLTGGASPYDVAKVLGDTLETIEKHYTPFVKRFHSRRRHWPRRIGQKRGRTPSNPTTRA